MTPQAALDRIAALCDEWPYPNGRAVIMQVRAILAEVAPEPGGDMPSPLARPGDMQSFGPESYKAGGVLDRDQAGTILWDFADLVRQGWSAVNAVHSALDRLAAAVRPVAGCRGAVHVVPVTAQRRHEGGRRDPA